jgi:sialate O-acetylesterase
MPEVNDCRLVCDIDLNKLDPEIHWDADNRSKIHTPFDRIAYCLELEDADGIPRSVHVSMDAFTDSLDKIGVATFQSGAHFQQNVTHLNVFSDVKGIVTGTNPAGGNIEF